MVVAGTERGVTPSLSSELSAALRRELREASALRPEKEGLSRSLKTRGPCHSEPSEEFRDLWNRANTEVLRFAQADMPQRCFRSLSEFPIRRRGHAIAAHRTDRLGYVIVRVADGDGQLLARAQADSGSHDISAS